MSKCEGCSLEGECSKNGACEIENNPLNRVKNVIGVMSGKGGVGKSTIVALTACELKRRGYSVGIMDADITGPSIPRLFGLGDKKAYAGQNGIQPVKTAEGISIMSMNFLLENEEDAVVWRGPIIAGAVKQFWTDVVWGDLDFLFVDMPPGTGDVPLTVMQSMPVNGIMLVSTPQNLVSMIVAKAVDMIQKMNINVLGVVENMSYLTCPDCGKKIEIFGDNAAKTAAEKVGAPLLGELPMDKDLVELSDEGRVEVFGTLKDNFKAIVDNVLDSLKKK